MTVRKVLLIEGITNIIVMLAKLIVGIKTGSAAIIGDALHSLSDVANNVIAFIAMRMTEAPPDHDHPYGHHKFEQLAVFGLASLLTVVAFEVALNGIKRFGQPVEHSTWGLAIMLIVLVINVVLSLWERGWARKLESDILQADASHTVSDVLTTITIIVGWQLAAHGYAWLDSIFAILVAGLIFYLAYDLFRRAIPILVDETAADTRRLTMAISRVPHVQDVRRVRSRFGGDGVIADVVVSVDGALTTEQSHRVANAIEKMLSSEFSIDDVTVHVEPSER